MYLKNAEKLIELDSSIKIVANKAVQAIQRAGFIHEFEVIWVDLNTAKNEMNKKIKSIQIHQVGAEAQQLFEQADAININGVAAQWIKHMKLAVAPIKSDFCFNSAIIMYIFYLPQPLFNFRSISKRARDILSNF